MEERRQIARFTIQRALLEHPRDATIPAALISNATQRLVQRCVSAPAALARVRRPPTFCFQPPPDARLTPDAFARRPSRGGYYAAPRARSAS